MFIPFTKDKLTITKTDIYELVLGTIFLLVSLVGCIMLSNFIVQFFGNINFILLLIHLMIIVCFVIIIRYTLNKMITNVNICNGILTLAGPIIGLASLFMSPMIKDFVGYYTFNNLVKSIK